MVLGKTYFCRDIEMGYLFANHDFLLLNFLENLVSRQVKINLKGEYEFVVLSFTRFFPSAFGIVSFESDMFFNSFLYWKFKNKEDLKTNLFQKNI